MNRVRRCDRKLSAQIHFWDKIELGRRVSEAEVSTYVYIKQVSRKLELETFLVHPSIEYVSE